MYVLYVLYVFILLLSVVCVIVVGQDPCTSDERVRPPVKGPHDPKTYRGELVSPTSSLPTEMRIIMSVAII